MILDFPIDAWLLLLVSVGLGLGLEVAFYARHRSDAAGIGDRRNGGRSATDGARTADSDGAAGSRAAEDPDRDPDA